MFTYIIFQLAGYHRIYLNLLGFQSTIFALGRNIDLVKQKLLNVVPEEFKASVQH